MHQVEEHIRKDRRIYSNIFESNFSQTALDTVMQSGSEERPVDYLDTYNMVTKLEYLLSGVRRVIECIHTKPHYALTCTGLHVVDNDEDELYMTDLKNRSVDEVFLPAYDDYLSKCRQIKMYVEDISVQELLDSPGVESGALAFSCLPPEIIRIIIRMSYPTSHALALSDFQYDVLGNRPNDEAGVVYSERNLKNDLYRALLCACLYLEELFFNLVGFSQHFNFFDRITEQIENANLSFRKLEELMLLHQDQ